MTEAALSRVRNRGQFRWLLWSMVCCIGVCIPLSAEPVIVKGARVEKFLGKNIQTLRVCTRHGTAIPFQIDEVTAQGEYVLGSGEEPNTDSGNGRLDPDDEIVFMREDCEKINAVPDLSAPLPSAVRNGIRLHIVQQEDTSEVFIIQSNQIAHSTKKYIRYDHSTQILSTPDYYAQFAKDRFHFIKAGVINPKTGTFLNLTERLKVEIVLKALWGLLPVHYTEDNLICFVKRYKTGPIRCIRRGDFHLSIGLGLKGSRAAVNQICYPQMVTVPVKVHIPFKFSRLFSEAWLEMTPVISTAGKQFTFTVAGCDIHRKLGLASSDDTLFNCMPAGNSFTVSKGRMGYHWSLDTDIPVASMTGSGYVLRPATTTQKGVALCGFRLGIREVAKGRYSIANRVFFPVHTSDSEDTTFCIDTASSLIIAQKSSWKNPVFELRREVKRLKKD